MIPIGFIASLFTIVALLCAVAIVYYKFPLHLIYKSKIGFQDTLDAISDPIAVVSSDHFVKRANRAYVSLVSKDFDEVIGQKCYSLLRKRTIPCEDCIMNEALTKNQVLNLERSAHPQGSGAISINFSPCTLTLEHTGRYVIEHIRDISILEKLKLDLETKNQSLAETMKNLKAAQHSIRDELRLARLIQRGILPKSAPDFPGLKISVTYHPVADVGGDIYDFIPLSPTRLGLFIGDASGHGLSAAFVGTISKMSLYNHRHADISVHQLLQLINKDLIDNVHTGHYITCFWGIIDLETNSITFSKAGHPNPVLIKKDGSIIQLNTQGTFIGILDSPVYEEKTVSFEKGDRIYLFTDGAFRGSGRFH